MKGVTKRGRTRSAGRGYGLTDEATVIKRSDASSTSAPLSQSALHALWGWSGKL